jgi:outer membrane protein TolC
MARLLLMEPRRPEKLRGRLWTEKGLTSLLWWLFSATLLPCVPVHAQTGYIPDYSEGPRWFPSLSKPFSSQQIPDLDLEDSPRTSPLLGEARIRLSLAQLNTAVVDNNLGIAVSRINNSIAQTDILRAKSGQAPRGLSGAPIPSGLFTGSLGSGLGQAGGGFGGGIGSAGGITVGGRAVYAFPRGTFDPTLVFNFSYDHPSVPLNTEKVAGVPAVTTRTTAFQIGYQQMFASGSTLNVYFSNQFQSSTQQALVYNPAVVSRISVQFTQQLLNGFGRSINRSLLTVSKNNAVIAKELFRQNAVSVLAQAQSAYWDLVASKESILVAESSLAVAQKLYEESKESVAVGTLSNLDVVSAESEVAARRRDVIVAQTELEARELAMKAMLSKKLVSEITDAILEPLDPLPEPSASDIPNLQDAIAVAVQNRPEMRVAEQNMANQDVVVRFTKNSLKPTLTAFAFFASAGLSGDRLLPTPYVGTSNNFSGGYGGALGQVWGFANPEYAFGISLSIPIKNRAAHADNLRARMERQQADTSMQRTRNQICLEVQKAIIALTQGKARVDSARQTVELRKQALDMEETKLAAGFSTSYQVTLSQRDYHSAQLAEVQARSAYAKALVELHRSMGTTLERAGIDLDAANQ